MSKPSAFNDLQMATHVTELSSCKDNATGSASHMANGEQFTHNYTIHCREVENRVLG